MQKWALPCTLGKAKQNPGSGRWPRPTCRGGSLAPWVRRSRTLGARASGPHLTVHSRKPSFGASAFYPLHFRLCPPRKRKGVGRKPLTGGRAEHRRNEKLRASAYATDRLGKPSSSFTPFPSSLSSLSPHLATAWQGKNCPFQKLLTFLILLLTTRARTTNLCQG